MYHIPAGLLLYWIVWRMSSWYSNYAVRDIIDQPLLFRKNWFHLAFGLIVLMFFGGACILLFLYNPWLVAAPFGLTVILVCRGRAKTKRIILHTTVTAVGVYASNLKAGQSVAKALDAAMESIGDGRVPEQRSDRVSPSLHSRLRIFFRMKGLMIARRPRNPAEEWEQFSRDKDFDNLVDILLASNGIDPTRESDGST